MNDIETKDQDDKDHGDASGEILDSMMVSQSFPYKPGSLWSKMKYHCKSIIVTNPRLFSLFLLYKSTAPRILALIDMYTDAAIALSLYTLNETLLFSLSLLLLSFPFMIIWVTSLRFIQKYVNDKQIGANYGICLNLFLVLYLFPPIGCIIAGISEIVFVFYDFYIGVTSFIKGKIMLIDKDKEISSMKQFRRIIEFAGESSPQLLLQLYMFVNLKDIKIVESDLIVSIIVSLINLIYNIYRLHKEAKFHCMTIVTYALSVLQLGNVPIVKLIPRLPGIKSGAIDCVNFNDFKIDKESLGPIFEAIRSVVVAFCVILAPDNYSLSSVC